MSKSSFDSSDHVDRIPTYEEALASTSGPPNWQRRSTSSSTSSSDERTRRIFEVVNKAIIPSFATHVSNLCYHVTIVLVPADVLSTSTTVTEKNVISPSIQSHRTTGTVVTLAGAENCSSFWSQQIVVQELDRVLRRCLSSPTSVATAKDDDKKTPPLALPPLQVQPAPEGLLPSRPSKPSWLKRTFVLPGEDHDPTGETGKWNLGWRSPDAKPQAADQYNWTPQPKEQPVELQKDEVAVQTNLRDVSFRVENEMGLLETTTVKCIWVEIEVGTY